MFERFTERARLELALREALSLGHVYIGTEHILLGLARVDEGVAARILLDFDADAEKIRNEVIRVLSGPGRRPQPRPVAADVTTPGFEEANDAVQRLKEAALEAQEFERAARLRDLQRKLLRLANDVTEAMEGAEFPLPQPPRPGRGAWEFRVVDLTGDAAAWETTLNELGADGWELSRLSNDPRRATFQRKAR